MGVSTAGHCCTTVLLYRATPCCSCMPLARRAVCCYTPPGLALVPHCRRWYLAGSLAPGTPTLLPPPPRSATP
eukprot:3772140-Rhodomonas_salina.3